MPIFKSKLPDVVIPSHLSLPAFVSQDFREYGDRTALVDPYGKRTFTYNQLSEAIDKVIKEI
jgi:hypothetical protein